MASFNRVMLMGNLTRDIELRYLPSGMAVAEFRSSRSRCLDAPQKLPVNTFPKVHRSSSKAV